MENGFNIWSFNGKHLYRILKDRFFQVITISFCTCALLAILCVWQWCKEWFVDVHLVHQHICMLHFWLKNQDIVFWFQWDTAAESHTKFLHLIHVIDQLGLTSERPKREHEQPNWMIDYAIQRKCTTVGVFRFFFFMCNSLFYWALP